MLTAQAVKDHLPILRRYARALTRDIEQADDLVQNCLVRALAKERLWQFGTNLRATAATVASSSSRRQDATSRAVRSTSFAETRMPRSASALVAPA